MAVAHAARLALSCGVIRSGLKAASGKVLASMAAGLVAWWREQGVSTGVGGQRAQMQALESLGAE